MRYPLPETIARLEPPLQRLSTEWLDEAGVEAAIVRLDLIDPLVSGNKWYKLAPYVERALQSGATGLISLGGPHSNHLHALAAAGQRAGLDAVGLLRGHPQETPTTRDLTRFGMRLHWLGYAGFRDRYAPGFWDEWMVRYPGHLCVPEGGGGLLGAQGCAPLVDQVHARLPALGWQDFDGWWLAAGTGATLAGLLMGERGRHRVHGALAGPPAHGVGREVDRLLSEAGISTARYSLVDAARRGFGRLDDELAAFMEQHEQETGIPLDPVYTGKALMALRDQIASGAIERGMRLVVVHTGGLQGRRTMTGNAKIA